MQGLLDDLRAYSNVSTRGERYERVEVDEAFDEAARLLRPSLQGASASLEVEPLPALDADRGQLVQLFRALLSNALRFRSSAPLQIAVGAERDGDCWRFVLSDNGVGIPEADRERIFRMLEHADRDGRPSGNGAGLAISRRIVERHGGRIWVQPTENGGSAFTFTLRERQEAPR
jgi:signal transduction histidine kinase